MRAERKITAWYCDQSPCIASRHPSVIIQEHLSKFVDSMTQMFTSIWIAVISILFSFDGFMKNFRILNYVVSPRPCLGEMLSQKRSKTLRFISRLHKVLISVKCWVPFSRWVLFARCLVSENMSNCIIIVSFRFYLCHQCQSCEIDNIALGRTFIKSL